MELLATSELKTKAKLARDGISLLMVLLLMLIQMLAILVLFAEL